MTTPLVATKYFIPPERAGVVARPRLLRQLNAGLQKKLTLVSAPAGFGKSTLVSAAVNAAEQSICWVSLDESDSDLQQFLSVLLTGLQRVINGFGVASAALLEATQPPATDVLVVTLLNDLAKLPSPVILVLDDYHAVDSPAVDEAMAFLLEHQPPSMHFLIATREDPALPLARFRACNELSEIRAADLRFTDTEAQEFFNDSMGLNLDAAQVSALDSRTEGWIAGLQLAALSLQHRSDSTDFIAAFSGSHRFIIDYLAEEVLSRQSAELRDFLLQTAVLDRFNAALCNAVTDSHRAASALNELERNNLFLVPLDEQRQWYRYHHLFGDVLKSRLRQTPFDIPTLHLRASQWFLAQGHVHEAVNHALLAEDVSHAANIIAQHWPNMRKREPEATFLGWMKALPDEYIAENPVLAAYYALTLLSYDIESAAEWIDTADSLLTAMTGQEKDSVMASLPGLLSVAKAYLAGATGDLAATVRHAREAHASLPENEVIWRGSAAILMGLVQWGAGDLASVEQALSEGYTAMKKGGEMGGAISATYLLAGLRIAQGQRKAARRLCNNAIKLAEALPSAPQGTANIYVILAQLALGKNDLQAAESLLETADKLGEHAKLLETAHHWYVIQSLIASRRGHYAAAADLLDEARDVQIPSPSPDFSPIDTLQARLDILRGDLASAIHWAKTSGLSPDDTPAYVQEFSHLTLVRLLLARFHKEDDQSLLSQALRLLARLQSAAEAGQHKDSLVDIYLLSAYCQQANGNSETALKLLQRALNRPEADYQACRFVGETDSERQWLERSMRSIETPDWAGALYARDRTELEHSKISIASQRTLIDPLSERELEVLRTLDSELSGPEIAASLFVSINTLRTHTKNIYSKLGVNNRRAAIRRASELGLG